MERSQTDDYANKMVTLLEALSQLIPREVTEVWELGKKGEFYPVCPRCQSTMEREYQNYCDRCGQKLDWTYYTKQLAVGELDFDW